MYPDENLVDCSKFSEGGIPKTSRIMVIMTLVVSKSVVIKKYGTLKEDAIRQYRKLFRLNFECVGPIETVTINVVSKLDREVLIGTLSAMLGEPVGIELSRLMMLCRRCPLLELKRK